MNKLKSLVTQFGCGIAVLLMLSPLAIIIRIEFYSTKEIIILLIISISYDVYMFQALLTDDAIKKEKEHYYNFVKDADKKLNLKLTDKEKYEHLQNYIENFFEKNAKK